MMTRLIAFLACLLASCSFAATNDAPTSQPTPTTLRVVQTTAVPTLERHLQPILTQLPDATAESAPTPTDQPGCTGTEPLSGAAHVVQADLAYREQTVVVQQEIHFVNRTGGALEQLVLDVEPNRLPGVFRLDSVTLDGDRPVQMYELAGRRLSVTLPMPLATACPIMLKLGFLLRIPQIGAGLDGFDGYFGFGARQINLAHWLPTIAAHTADGWLVHDVARVGEQTVADPADWDVTLRVDGARDTLKVAGPGAVTQPAAMTWRFLQTDSRDFALSLSERFKVVTQQAQNGVTVELFYFDDAIVSTENGVVDGAAHALNIAASAITLFSNLYGAYPHQRYVVVQGDFRDGMEFCDLVFVSTDWFRSYTGTPNSYLTLITVHETSHQWWYNRVGSDQALHPWMDEALAVYSEYLFVEEYFPQFRDWWWEFRVDRYIPPDFSDRTVNKSVFEIEEVRPYINAIYLNGGRMMDAFRQELGTEVFFDWLRRYAEVGQGRITTPDDFWSVLTPEQLDRVRPIRERYMS